MVATFGLALTKPLHPSPRPARPHDHHVEGGTAVTGQGSEVHAEQKRSSVMMSAVNLIKTIAGFGSLCLPAGIERLSDGGLSSSQALGLGIALLLAFAVINLLSFLLIGAACERTGTQSYTAAAAASVGPETAWLVTLSSIFLCATAAVGCQVVVSITLVDLLSFWLLLEEAALPRRALQLGVVLCVLLPLCRLPSLRPLARTSFIGVLGTTATALCIVVRWLDGSYMPEGAYFEDVRWTPAFSQPSPLSGGSSVSGLVQAEAARLPSAYSLAFLLSLTSNAYLAHQNAPLLYLESAADADGGKYAPFQRATLLAFAFSCALFLCIGGAGFATFGEASQPLIINNYAASDPLAAFARLGMLLTVLFEFPLLERPFRLTVSEVCGVSEHGATSPLARGPVASASRPRPRTPERRLAVLRGLPWPPPLALAPPQS